jgi:hypothetical protein
MKTFEGPGFHHVSLTFRFNLSVKFIPRYIMWFTNGIFCPSDSSRAPIGHLQEKYIAWILSLIIFRPTCLCLQSVYIPNYVHTPKNNVRMSCLALLSRLKYLYIGEIFKFLPISTTPTSLQRLESQKGESLNLHCTWRLSLCFTKKRGCSNYEDISISIVQTNKRFTHVEATTWKKPR